MAVCFGSFVKRCFFGRRRTLGGLLYDRCGSGDLAEVFPVVAVVTYEVRDLAEGLVCDGVLEWHDEDGVVGDEWSLTCVMLLFCVLCGVCMLFFVMRSRCEAGFFVFSVICANVRS